MLSSANKDNRYQEISADIDHRTNGYKSRTESLIQKTDAAILLIQRALASEIKADYIDGHLVYYRTYASKNLKIRT